MKIEEIRRIHSMLHSRDLEMRQLGLIAGWRAIRNNTPLANTAYLEYLDRQTPNMEHLVMELARLAYIEGNKAAREAVKELKNVDENVDEIVDKLKRE